MPRKSIKNNPEGFSVSPMTESWQGQKPLKQHADHKTLSTETQGEIIATPASNSTIQIILIMIK